MNVLSETIAEFIERVEEDKLKALPLYSALRPVSEADIKAGLPVADLHDLALKTYATHTAFVEDKFTGRDQVVIWYGDSCNVLPVEVVLVGYRVLDLKLVQGGVQ